MKDKDAGSTMTFLQPGIFIVIGLAIMSTEDINVTPWGMLFLGIGCGHLITIFEGRRAWRFLRHLIDWKKVEDSVQEASPELPSEDSSNQN